MHFSFTSDDRLAYPKGKSRIVGPCSTSKAHPAPSSVTTSQRDLNWATLEFRIAYPGSIIPSSSARNSCPLPWREG